jgi:ABC-type uncharacterized transport system YnjBCD ATPase subunit
VKKATVKTMSTTARQIGSLFEKMKVIYSFRFLGLIVFLLCFTLKTHKKKAIEKKP